LIGSQVLQREQEIGARTSTRLEGFHHTEILVEGYDGD